MATFCDIPNCPNLSFRTDRLTRKHYCSNHWRQYSTDIDKRSITQKALSRGKIENKPSKEPRFQKVIQTPSENDIIEISPLSDLNSRIDWVTPSPESYDAPPISRILSDEYGQMADMGVSESMANLTSDLDQVLSLLIRYKYARPDGMVKCFCCPKIIPIKEAHNSHYIKRGNRSTRFLESNCRPSCPECNNDHNYDETPYTNALEREQKGLAEQLKELGKETYKATRSELKQLLIEYRSKLEVLKTKITK